MKYLRTYFLTLISFVLKLFMNSYNINNLEYSNFSQNGEDGIIQFFTDRLKNNNKFFVEIGCGVGLENNSTNLVLNNWSGVVCDIPYNIKNYHRLMKIIQPSKKIHCVSGFINIENIKNIINDFLKKEINFFSLDIDSYDFYILLEVLKNNIFPQIICVEYNSFLGKNPYTIEYTPNFRRYSFDKERGLYFGSSLEAWKILLKKYNYEFICVDKNGVNAFFILPEFFEKDIFDYRGLEFVYNKVFTKKYNLEGHILEKELIQKFEKKFININKLI